MGNHKSDQSVWVPGASESEPFLCSKSSMEKICTWCLFLQFKEQRAFCSLFCPFNCARFTSIQRSVYPDLNCLTAPGLRNKLAYCAYFVWLQWMLTHVKTQQEINKKTIYYHFPWIGIYFVSFFQIYFDVRQQLTLINYECLPAFVLHLRFKSFSFDTLICGISKLNLIMEVSKQKTSQ